MTLPPTRGHHFGLHAIAASAANRLRPGSEKPCARLSSCSIASPHAPCRKAAAKLGRGHKKTRLLATGGKVDRLATGIARGKYTSAVLTAAARQACLSAKHLMYMTNASKNQSNTRSRPVTGNVSVVIIHSAKSGTVPSLPNRLSAGLATLPASVCISWSSGNNRIVTLA